MKPRLHALGTADRAVVLDFLAQNPVENLFLASKVDAYGVDRRRLGKLFAYVRDGEITSLLLDGGTLFVAGHDPEATALFASQLGQIRRCTSILGPAVPVLRLFVALAERWPGAWGSISNVRRRQPLMLLEEPPEPAPDPRVRQLTVDDFPSYLDASVAMYTDEIGSSPFRYGSGYERFVMQRLVGGEAFGIVENGRVIFKADLGPKLGDQAQLQGVWVLPDLRGQGLSVPALSGMLRLAMRQWPAISLYVNDFNTAAIRSYEKLGFVEVGALATVHY